jgi:hypothetical protein
MLSALVAGFLLVGPAAPTEDSEAASTAFDGPSADKGDVETPAEPSRSELRRLAREVLAGRFERVRPFVKRHCELDRHALLHGVFVEAARESAPDHAPLLVRLALLEEFDRALTDYLHAVSERRRGAPQTELTSSKTVEIAPGLRVFAEGPRVRWTDSEIAAELGRIVRLRREVDETLRKAWTEARRIGFERRAVLVAAKLWRRLVEASMAPAPEETAETDA